MIGKIIRFLVIAAWLVVPGLNKWLEIRPLGTQASLESPVVNQGKADQLPDRLLSPPQAPLQIIIINHDYSVNEDDTLTVAAPGVLTGSTDANDAAVTSDVSNGTLQLNLDGSFTYTPNQDYNGEDTFTYEAHDINTPATTASAIVTITVNSVNDAPSFTVGSNPVVNEDSGATTLAGWATALSPGPTNEASQTLSFTYTNDNTALFSTQPAINTTNGDLTFTPATNAFGTANITATLHDTGGTLNGGTDQVSHSFTITVNPVNDAPSFTVGTNPTVNEDAGATTLTGWATSLSPGPANESSQTLSFTYTNDNTALFSTQPAINTTNGNLTFTSATNASGVANLTATLHDTGGTANGGTDQVTHNFTITVNAVNDAPVAVNDTYNTNEDATLNIAAPGVLSNDTDLENNPLTAILNASTSNGSLTFNNDGSFTYTPNLDFNGSDSFTYHAFDGTDNSNVATVTINVTAVNDAPSFTVGTNPTVNEDSTATTLAGWATNISRGPTNEASQTLTFSLTNDNTTLFSAQPAINSTTGDLTFTPAANAFGTANVTATLQDSGGTANGGVDSVVHTFIITVSSVNDAPTFTVGSNPTVNEDAGATTLTGWATGISRGPANEASQTLTFSLVSSDPALFSAPPALNTTNGNLTFTPAANISGSATITATLQDSGGVANGGIDSVAHTFTITINPVNDAPSFTVGANPTVNEDSGPATYTSWATNISPGPTDEGTQTLTFTVTNDNTTLFSVQPAIATSGNLTFTPAANANGTANVTATLQDNGGTANGGVNQVTHNFTITVNSVNDVPVATNDTYSTKRNNPLTPVAPGVLGNDTDPDVPTQTLTAVRNADVTNGTLTLNSDGSFTYTPPNNFLGSTTFTYHAFDGTASSNIATVTITVTIDDPPLAASDAYTITEDTQLSVLAANGVLDNDSDPDSASITATLLTGPTHGTLSLAADGSFVYIPSLNYNGTDSFYYRAFDGYNYSSQEVVNLTITPVNDAPNAVDDSYTLNLSTETNGTLDIGNSALGLLANDSDVDAGTTLTASFATQAQHGSVQIYPDGSFVYTPNQGFYGADSFTYQVSDGSLTDTAQVDLVVDLQAPDVTWLQPLNDPDPANNENVLYLGAPGGYLPFEVLATDNRGIDHIEFYDYDPNLNIWFLLATSNGEPVNIKLDQLLNHWNQIVVSVYDTSGNLTNSIYLKIWQPARYRQFLAVMHK